MYDISCHICHNKFTQKKNLYAHVRKIHKVDNIPVPLLRSPQLLCSECSALFLFYKQLRSHIINTHKIDIKKEAYRFQNKEDFLKWKEAKESELLCSYVQNTGQHGKKLVYVCHRSYKTGSFKKTEDKKCAKSQESCKMTFTCPSTVEVTITNNAYDVTIWLPHMGHSCSLKHINLTKTEKQIIADDIDAQIKDKTDGISIEAVKLEPTLAEVDTDSENVDIEIKNIASGNIEDVQIKDELDDVPFEIIKHEPKTNTKYMDTESINIDRQIKNIPSDNEHDLQVKNENYDTIFEVTKHELSVDEACCDTPNYWESLNIKSENDSPEVLYSLLEDPSKEEHKPCIKSESSHDHELSENTVHFPNIKSCQIFNTMSKVDQRLELHTEKKCKNCNELFDTNHKLIEHLQTHAETMQYECELCNKKFRSKSYLKIHLRIHTGERPYKCEICEKPFKSGNDLNSHMRYHTGEKPHKCTVCEKRFFGRSKLVIHLRTHTGERPYKCEICQKMFIENYILRQHMRIHTGEQLFKCEVCNKKFCKNSQLMYHMKIHTREKLFECEMCPKKFASSGHLMCHMRTHSQERPFKCEICYKKFRSNSNLKEHVETHTGRTP